MEKSPKSMISVMALLGRNYIRRTTGGQGNAVVEKSISSAPFFRFFHHTSSHRHHQMSARNVGSVCSYGTNSWHTIPCTSKLTSVNISHRNKLLWLLQTGRSHVVICNDIWQEVWMSDISSECPDRQWWNCNCFCSPISTQGRNFDTICHKFNLVSKFDEINQGLPNSLTNLWTVMHLLSCQIP